MRHLRLVLPALAFVVAGTWSTQALACDKDKATATTAASEISAAYEAEVAAMTSSAKASERCASKSAKTTAATVATSSDHCGSKRAKATAATAAMASDHCAAKSAKATAVLAGAGSACGTKSSKTSAVTAGAHCKGNGIGTMAGKTAHGDCDACADMAICGDEIEAAGVRTQVVPLKNGVMFVYTAESPGKASAVQSAMARRSDRLTQLVTAGDKARLCSECKSLRGAMASGKLQREVVNIEGGALTLMTSSDASVVAKIHTMVEHHKGSRSKS